MNSRSIDSSKSLHWSSTRSAPERGLTRLSNNPIFGGNRVHNRLFRMTSDFAKIDFSTASTCCVSGWQGASEAPPLDSPLHAWVGRPPRTTIHTHDTIL